MELQKIQAVIEAMLFAAGDPVPVEMLVEILEIDNKTVNLIINKMNDQYKDSNRGILIREIDGAYQLSSKPEFFEYVKRLFEPRQKQGITQAGLETLAIVAYNQPVTRAEIEKIRGVSSDSSINSLVERNLIKEAGRMDAPGKPFLYETTDEFLRVFGYKSILDLPAVEETIKTEHYEQSRMNEV